MSYRVINDTPGEAGWDGFDDDELDMAIVLFMRLRAPHRRVSLEFTGEEFEYE